MPLKIDMTFLDRLVDIARRAGDEIMKVYRTDFQVVRKADASPVTVADQAAEALIMKAIRTEISDRIPFVGEEGFADGDRPDVSGASFWLVDPLDGTKEFVERNDEFTVNIALIERGEAVAGVVHAPALDLSYWGAAVGAFMREDNGPTERIACRRTPAEGMVALISRHHNTTDVADYLDTLRIAEQTTAGSSLKFCLIAAGKADIYPRFGPTHEWDTAAAHAVLRFAGGHIVDRHGQELRYGKPGFINPHFIAHGPDTPAVRG